MPITPAIIQGSFCQTDTLPPFIRFFNAFVRFRQRNCFSVYKESFPSTHQEKSYVTVTILFVTFSFLLIMSKTILTRAHVAFCAALCAMSTSASALRFWTQFLDTTPAGVIRSTQDREQTGGSYWDDAKNGILTIIEDGDSLFMVPTYTNHPGWDWPQRAEENAHPYGMGIGRQIIDDRGNERSVYATAFIDSNYYIEPLIGYSWLARYPIGNTGLHWGAGYSLNITAREDYGNYIPLPLPLPVAKIGTDTIGFYGTFIPFTNVFFFYTQIKLDDSESRKAPLPESSPWAHSTDFIYAGGGYTLADNGEENTANAVHSGNSWHMGWRHYTDRSWATDFSYRSSGHEIVVGEGKQDLDIETYAFQLQYNMTVSQNWRLYAGGGIGYSRCETRAGHKDGSIHPVLSMGTTYALTKNFFIDASMTTSFPRFEGAIDSRPGFALRPAPVDLSVSMGIAF